MESENVKIEDSTTTTATTASNNGDTSGDTTTTASNNGDTSGDIGSSTTTTTASTVKDENVENDAKPPPELVKNKGQLAQEKHSEEYTKEFEEIKFAKISPKDPYWPCIIYSPAIAPPKNLAYKKWMGMSEVKQSNNYIVYWFGYNMQFSCISKNKIISFKENEDEMVKTKGGKKKLSAKMQELFDASIVEAKTELEKPKAARMQDKHLSMLKEKKKNRRRRLPAIETLINRRIALADEDGDKFPGKIIEVKTGTSKEGVEKVVLVRVQYDDGETDTDLDLAVEDFEWLKEVKKKKVKVDVKEPSSSEEEESSSEEEESSSSSEEESSSDDYSSEDDSDSSEEDVPKKRRGRKPKKKVVKVYVNLEEKGVKKKRAFEKVKAFFEEEFAGEHPSYAYEVPQRKPAAKKKKRKPKKKKKRKKVKAKYKGMSKEERRAARKKHNEVKERRRRERKKHQEEVEEQKLKEERVNNPSVKRVKTLEAESDDEDEDSFADDEDEEEKKPKKRSRQQMDDESEWDPTSESNGGGTRKRTSRARGSSSAKKRARVDDDGGSSHKKSKKDKKKKKEKKDKGSNSSNMLVQYNAILKGILDAAVLDKKQLKKGLKKLAQVEISTYSALQKSGLVETMLKIKKHGDKDVKTWGKGIINMWKAKFK